MADEELELDEEEGKGGGKKKLIIIIVAAVLLLGGGGAAAMFFLEMGPFAPSEEELAEGEEGAAEAEAEEEEAAEAEGEDGEPEVIVYHKINPAFVVRWHDKSARMAQITVQLMSKKQTVIDEVMVHEPRIKNDLLMLYSQQDPADLRTRAGKEKLQQDSLQAVQDILRDEIGKPGVEQVYFTGFVIQ